MQIYVNIKLVIKMNKKFKLGLASDHRGYKLKKELINYLQNNYEIIDCGAYDDNSCDYPDFAYQLGKKIVNNEVDYGIGICGSGIGISIALNKIPGVYCAKVNNSKEARYTRLDNNTNCVAFSEEVTLDEAINIIETFVNTEFSNLDKHNRRIQKVKDIESGIYNG